MIRNFVCCIIAMFISFGALAGTTSDAVRTAGWENLTESEKAEITKMVADKSAAKSSVTGVLTDVKKVDEWVGVGERIGKMMGGAAKEVGVAVNEFIQTPVGKMTMAIVVWKTIGGPLVHLVGGFIVLFLGFIVMTAIYKRLVRTEIKYNKEEKNVFGNHPVLAVERGAFSSDDFWAMFLGSLMFIGLALVCMFTF